MGPAASFNSNEMSLWALVSTSKRKQDITKITRHISRVFNGVHSFYMIVTAGAAHVRTGKVVVVNAVFLQKLSLKELKDFVKKEVAGALPTASCTQDS